jgi:hypothetical protein
MNEENAMNNAMAHNIMAMLGVILIPLLLISLLMIISQWVIYTKAGKPGWAILVPIYNFIVMLQIVGRPWYHMFFLLIPIYNIIFAIQVIHGLSKSFGKDAGFTVGLIFLGIIFYPMLAFSKSIQYVGPGGVAAPAAQ